jgi:DNA-binding beta-propeller fold protein YncE
VTGTLDGRFYSPNPICVDSQSGYVFVLDAGNSRVEYFNTSGAFLGKRGTYGAGNGQFRNPWGIAVRPSDHRLYVVDRGNNRIQVFKTVSFKPTAWPKSAGAAPASPEYIERLAP